MVITDADWCGIERITAVAPQFSKLMNDALLWAAKKPQISIIMDLRESGKDHDNFEIVMRHTYIYAPALIPTYDHEPKHADDSLLSSFETLKIISPFQVLSMPCIIPLANVAPPHRQRSMKLLTTTITRASLASRSGLAALSTVWEDAGASEGFTFNDMLICADF